MSGPDQTRKRIGCRHLEGRVHPDVGGDELGQAGNAVDPGWQLVSTGDVKIN